MQNSKLHAIIEANKNIDWTFHAGIKNVAYEAYARLQNWMGLDIKAIEKLEKQWGPILPEIFETIVGHNFEEALALVEQQCQDKFGLSIEEMLILEQWYGTNPYNDPYCHDMEDNMHHWLEQSLQVHMTGIYNEEPDWRNVFDEDFIQELQNDILNNIK